MSTTRQQIADYLKTLLDTATVKTVVTTNSGGAGLTDYREIDVPLVEIFIGEEIPQYEVGRHALVVDGARVVVHYLSDGAIEEQELLIGEIKDALGGDPTLGGLVEMVNIVRIEPGGEYPLYNITFILSVEYEKHIAVSEE